MNRRDWDLEAFAVEFGELQALDVDLSLTGFDPLEIDAFTLTPDAPKEPALSLILPSLQPCSLSALASISARKA